MPLFKLSDPSMVSFGCEHGDFVRDEDGLFDLPEGPEVIDVLRAINVTATRIESEPPAVEPPATEAEHRHRRGRKAPDGGPVDAI